MKVFATRMKNDTLFHHKEVIITCEESMGDVNDYPKLLEPRAKFEKSTKSKRANVICNHYHKPKAYQRKVPLEPW